jgi:FkbM family methyltransferase
MRATRAVDISLLERGTPHNARSFTEIPGPDAATRLLGEIAGGSCAFSPVPMDRPVALYGAGDLGRLAREFLTSVGHDFVMAIDRNAEALAAQPAWSGVRLLHPDAVSEPARHEVRLAISVVAAPYVPLERALTEHGFADIVPFYDLAESFRDRHPLSNGWFAPRLTEQERVKTDTVLARWDDDLSRAHHLQFLAWRRLREEWTFDAAPVRGDNRFFIPEVAAILRDDEILLDAGAHHGTVINAFISQTNRAFRQIIAVEPDPENCLRLQENLRAWRLAGAHVTILTCALSDEDGEALFHPRLDYASQLSPTGTTFVETCRLDTLDLAPTIVKLHLEGAELAALRGGRRTLLANRPIVAATIYHNTDGIWETPLWLMDTLPDYRFLLRVHSWCGTGAVIYAIPKERTRLA